MTRRFRISFALLGLALAGWLGASLTVGYQLTRRRQVRFDEGPMPVTVAGSELAWSAADGVAGHAWWTPAAEPARSRAPVVLLLHSLGGTRLEWAPQLEGFHRRGVASLAATLRCHGGTGGEINDFGRSARLDVLALVAELEQLAPGRPVLIVARSFGAAAALFAAQELAGRVAGYVLEAPYFDLSSAVHHRTCLALGRGLGDLAAIGLQLVAPLWLDEPGSISPSEALRRMGSGEGVVLLAGALDRHAPLAEQQALQSLVEPAARLEVFPAAAHARCFPQDPERWWRILDDVLEAAGQ